MAVSIHSPDLHSTDTQIRLDVWLDVACLYRTRSEARNACNGGKVEVNGQPGKPHRLVRPGDRIRLSRPLGRKQAIVIRGVAEQHVPKAAARALYEDLTPAPTAEEVEIRRIERIYRAVTPPRAPDKRERRELRRLKGR